MRLRTSSPILLGFAAFVLLAPALVASCKDDKVTADKGTAPPPTVSVAKAGACAQGGGSVGDPVSQDFFPKTVTGSAGIYCIDPQGDTKTYGEKGKLTMDEVCTTAFDGECEIYKQFGLRRVVSLRYVDGSGAGGSVEVNLSQFEIAGGAYAMYTKRVIAGSDPADPKAPKIVPGVQGAAAIGNGRGYAWRGQYLAELTYINEEQAQAQLSKSSEAILPSIAKDIAAKLPGAPDKPASARALPEQNLVPTGIEYFIANPVGLKTPAAGAIGYYKDGETRYRVLSIVRDDADQAKDTMKVIKGRAGALPVAQLADEATHVMLQENPESARNEYVIARKGSMILGVGDEDRAPKGAPKVSKDDKLAKLRAFLAAAPATTSASSGSPGAASSPADAGKK
jgi:hypothetical protein